jgi:DNA-binding NarL/FixJ family response regulator
MQSHLLRDLLRQVIASQEDVIWSLSSFPRWKAAGKPDVVLINASDAAIGEFGQLRRKWPGAKVIVIDAGSGHLNILESMKLGAVGFILKDSPAKEVLSAIQKVGHGDWVLPPRVIEAIGKQSAAIEEVPALMPAIDTGLTSREREVADLIREGIRDKEIAARLNIALDTVKHHVHQVLKKHRCRSRGEFIHMYMAAQSMQPES